MAIIQAILALIGRSLGRIASALFGWAVVALFGQTSAREKLWLSVLVGAAAAWPILLIGVIWPRLASLVLAFVPLPAWIPTWAIRVAWLVLAAAVPFALGIAVAARSRGSAAPIPGTSPAVRHATGSRSATAASPMKESMAVRLARGLPITIAVAASFFIVFVTVPIRRLSAVLRRRVDVFVPLVTDAAGYEQVARDVAATLARHGMEVSPCEPGWEVTAPARILLRLGGPSFRGYVAERYAAFRGPRLDIVLYPNALSVSGSTADTARAHGLLAEALTAAPAYQTFDPGAQDIERQIRSVWAVFRQNPVAHAGAPPLIGRLRDIARGIGELAVDYDEWQVVYRQALQLDRALRGDPQLLEAQACSAERDRGRFTQEAEPMTHVHDGDEARALSLRHLVGEISAKTTLLARKELDLAKAEIKADLKSELGTAKGLGVSALLTLLGLEAFLMAGVLALAVHMRGWLAALLVGVILLAVAAVVGHLSWARRVTDPLSLTRKTFRETVQWAKERLA